MFRDGLLDEKMWQSYQKALSATPSFPRTRPWWEDQSHLHFDNEFADMVNRYLSDVPLKASAHQFERIEARRN